MSPSRFLTVLVAAAVLAVAAPVPAQNAPAGAAPPSAAPISQDLLDSLLAPIALYPDQLLSQVLMAATYPLEVVEAARFVKANPNLKGAALDDALKDKTWDASVLSLSAFPQILDMMNDQLDWTQRLGDAFLDDPNGVMRTVQSLRARAQQQGNLQTTQQQKVYAQEGEIIIEPAQPQYVYVPVYDPTVIYGTWWAPAYRPWFWFPPPIWGYPPYYGGALAAGIFWGTAWAITANNWGWCHPNWHGNSININVHNNNLWVNRPGYHDRYQNNGNWNHNVEHRRGVAYRDTATGNKYRPTNNAGVQTREGYRGRDNTTRPATGTMDRSAPGMAGSGTRPSPGTFDRPAPGGAGTSGARTGAGTFDRAAPGPSGTGASRPSPGANASNFARSSPSGNGPSPAYQPYTRPQVQQDANRGAQSRAAMQQRAAPSPPHAAPSPQRAAPSANHGGGGGGGGGGQGRGR